MTLEEFLLKFKDVATYGFALYTSTIEEQKKIKTIFYIHANGVNSNTLYFQVAGNILTPISKQDLKIYNL
jgi:hypothetical protein